MKISKLLLSLVMMLALNAATVASADVNGPYISGQGAGYAVLIVEGSNGVFIVAPSGLSGSVSNPSQVGTLRRVEMAASASGSGNYSSRYESSYSITIPAGKTATAHYSTHNGNYGSYGRVTIDGVSFSGGTDGSMPLSSGSHSLRAFAYASYYQGESGSAHITVTIN